MTEFQPHDSESDDEEGKLIPTNMDEAFAVDGARRNLEGVWNPEDPAWKEAYESHRLMMEAGLTEPAVDIDKVSKAIADLSNVRKAVDEVFNGHDNQPTQHPDDGEDPASS